VVSARVLNDSGDDHEVRLHPRSVTLMGMGIVPAQAPHMEGSSVLVTPATRTHPLNDVYGVRCAHTSGKRCGEARGEGNPTQGAVKRGRGDAARPQLRVDVAR